MSADGWYPAARDDHAHGGGSGAHLGPVTIGCLHTTESPLGKYAPSDHDYGNFGHTNYPHFTADVKVIDGKRTFVCYQHISIREAAKALKNRAGGVQTNREGVVQIEVVGSATKPLTDDPVMVEGLGRLMRWIESETDIPRKGLLAWKPYPASYGEHNGVRLTNSAWVRYEGWLGHQHVPENDHGDPGDIDIHELLVVGVSNVAVKPAVKTEPAPAPTPPAIHKEIDMLIVKDPDSPNQFVCDVSTKRHITPGQRAVYVAAGVPFVSDETNADARRDLLKTLVDA